MPHAAIHLHQGDLPDGIGFGAAVAVDTETMGLDPHRDRLCLVQLSAGDNVAHLVQIVPERLGGRGADCPNLKRLLSDPGTVKLMHFARFDVAVLQAALGWTDSHLYEIKAGRGGAGRAVVAAGGAPGPRRPAGAGGSLLRLPAGTHPARPAGLRGARHLRPLTAAPVQAPSVDASAARCPYRPAGACRPPVEPTYPCMA